MLKLLSAKSWPPTALDAALLTTPTSRVVSWGEVSSDATLGDSGPASGTTTPAPEGPPGTTSGSKGQKAAGGGGGGGAESDEEGEVAGGGGGSAEDEMLRGLAEAEEGDDLLATLLSEGGAGTASAAAAAQELAAAAAAVAGGEDTGMEEGAGEEEGAGPASSGSGGGSGVVLAVPTRLYKLVMEVDRRGPGGGGGGSSPDQAQVLEVTALVRVAANYPLTLPVVRVSRLVGRPGGGSSKKGEVLLEPGKALWMEQQVGVVVRYPRGGEGKPRRVLCRGGGKSGRVLARHGGCCPTHGPQQGFIQGWWQPSDIHGHTILCPTSGSHAALCT